MGPDVKSRGVSVGKPFNQCMHVFFPDIKFLQDTANTVQVRHNGVYTMERRGIVIKSHKM